MPEKNAYLAEPALELREGTPIAQAFDDVYFSRAGGVAETTYVFLAGNSLPQRWAGCSGFTIAELGFGTGLNFLVAWKRFRETAPKDAVLHFLSVEKFPFRVETLRALLALQPELKDEAAQLLAVYPLRVPGMHRVHLPQAVLSVYFGEVADALREWEAVPSPIDAWFLDGFSPAKNPAMWGEDVLQAVGRLSGPGTSFATFTAAGAVKRGLMAAGFAVEKRVGFGSKRDMLVGKKEVAGGRGPGISALPSSAMVIGAGIAGASVARALAERGVAVTVIAPGGVADGASGNAAGVLFPQLTKRWSVAASWYFVAYGFMLRQLTRWREWNVPQGQPGMLRLPRDAEEEMSLAALNETLGLDPAIVRWLSREEASAQAGVELQTGAAFFPQGSWVNPPALCRALLQHTHITLCERAAAKQIMRVGNTWCVTLADGSEHSTPVCVVAAAGESAGLLADYGLKLGLVGGQVSEIAAGDVAAPLRSIVCLKGYVIPLDDRYLIGATYHRDGDLLAVTSDRHAQNVAELARTLPGWYRNVPIGGRSAVRAVTPDKLPYVGAVDAGLYVSTGHGSRGLISAPLSAEMLAAEICREPLVVDAALRTALNPLRFKR